MKTATPKESTQSNYNQVPLSKIIKPRRTTKVPVKLRIITRKMVLEDAFTYQIPMEVTQILELRSGECFPICPRCQISIEREYMRFCDRCGQRLGWNKLENAVFVYPGCSHSGKTAKSVTFLYFKYIYPIKHARGHNFGKRRIGQTYSRSADQEGIYTAGSGK